MIRGEYGNTVVDMSDELVSIANGQKIQRRRVKECMAKYFRPTISPFGLVTPCDLKAEPRFAHGTFNLGGVRSDHLINVVDRFPDQFIPDTCSQCMPSSRTGNLVYTKLISDYKLGIELTQQPFFFRKN